MKVSLSTVVDFLESEAPVKLAEKWDNVGLLIGYETMEVHHILVCLDITPEVVAQAVREKADLIISHHPFIFGDLRRILASDQKGRMIQELIRNHIAVYAAHTNFDVAENGLNKLLGTLLGLKDMKHLSRYASEKLFKVVVYVPENDAMRVHEAMSQAGAGFLGNYSDCAFMAKGKGYFRPLAGSEPYIGEQDVLSEVDEVRLETVVPHIVLKKVLEAMHGAHPYEEVAYDIFPMENTGHEYGLGKVGVLEEPETVDEFVGRVKFRLKVPVVKVVGNAPLGIRKVAVFCGAYDSDHLNDVIRSRADVLVTGDLKYHAAQELLERGICVVDAGHFGTEHIFVQHLSDMLRLSFEGIRVSAVLGTDIFRFA